MSTYRGAYARPMREIFDEAFEVLRQDAAEYGFIGLVGAVVASIAVLLPALIGGPVAAAILGPIIVLAAVLTLATAQAALAMAGSGLQPDASAALRNVGWHAVALLRPWLLLMVILSAASAGVGFAAPHMGPVPAIVALPLLVGLAAFYAYPRSLYAVAIFEHELSSRDAIRASVAVVDRAGGRVQKAWAVALAPAGLFALLTALAGFDAVAGAIVTFFFVLALPVQAILMSLLFVDTATSQEANRDAPPAVSTPAVRRT